MYIKDRLTAHSILKYGWTKEFFEQFAPLKHLGIEIAPQIVRPFHVFIQQFVNSHIKNNKFVMQMARKHRFTRLMNIQQSLARIPARKYNLLKVAHRQAICMPGRLAQFAVDRFADRQVILIIYSVHDEKEIAKVKLPKTFQLYRFHEAVDRIRMSAVRIRNIEKAFDACIKRSKNHIIFSQPRFIKYMKRQFVRGAKAIQAMETLIRKQPIGIILDHAEIINPGATMALLARKFNLPFVNMPQMLIADRTLIPTRASHHFAWGEIHRNWLIRRGIDKRRIFITGNIAFEYAQREHERVAHRNPLDRFSIPRHHLVFVFTTQPFHHSVGRTILSWIRNTIDKNLPVTFLIKPHPADKVSYEEASRWPNVHVISPVYSIYHVIDRCHFLMTISSTTSIQALMNGKGIIHLGVRIPYHYDHHNDGFNSFLKEGKAGVSVSNATQFKQTILKIVNDKLYHSQIIRNGQTFLSTMLKMNPAPSVVTERLIQKLLPRPKK